jgi:hypothetical protein
VCGMKFCRGVSFSILRAWDLMFYIYISWGRVCGLLGADLEIGLEVGLQHLGEGARVRQDLVQLCRYIYIYIRGGGVRQDLVQLCRERVRERGERGERGERERERIQFSCTPPRPKISRP